MSKICCITHCKRRAPGLVHVPAKRFCVGKEYEWADKLERIILGLRSDPGIKNLYQRDTVAICKNHFASPTDFRIAPGGYETLAVGALPTLDLTPKSIPSTSATSRPAPKERFYIPKIYHNSYNVLLKAMKREVEKREDWLIVVNEDYFKLINTPIDANTNYTVPK
uniref:THAP-type domain-containing protein n=2 Tax=Ciona intestinalis TaxID=7719 RepID=F6W558_CIOIN